ncbi:helix-turn-helix transcriptional regulator [Bacillus altitudinis]|uniref:helix-turn-helix transcriptional regulator n=1 Tax=Bacillus altitudinis TaxID=293387 RepID=UPI0035E2D923
MSPELLRTFRVTRKMTQADLADKLGCSTQMIALIERQERRFTERMANRFMVAFNLDEKKLQDLRKLREAIVFDE